MNRVLVVVPIPSNIQIEAWHVIIYKLQCESWVEFDILFWYLFVNQLWGNNRETKT